MSRDPLSTEFYSTERMTKGDIEKVLRAFAGKAGNNLEWTAIGKNYMKYAPLRQNEIKRVAAKLQPGGAIDDDTEAFSISINNAEMMDNRHVQGIFNIYVYPLQVDVREALWYIKRGDYCNPHYSNPLERLASNLKYTATVRKILKEIGEKVVFAIGEDAAMHNDGTELCCQIYPQCVTHNHWIQFYGAPLLDDEITNLLLEAPVYKAEKIKDGVLIVETPISVIYLPYEDYVEGQPQEIQDLVKYRNQGIITEAYFKQHDLHEKLRKKVEEFDKQAKEQKGETE